MKAKILISSAAFVVGLPVYANKVVGVDENSPRIESGKAYELTVRFADPEQVACGLRVFWGDGKEQQIRLGNDQEVKSPYKLTHVYNSVGRKNIKIEGTLIRRGLKSLPPCEAMASGFVDVIDSVTPENPALTASNSEVAIARADTRSKLPPELASIAGKVYGSETSCPSGDGTREWTSVDGVVISSAVISKLSKSDPPRRLERKTNVTSFSSTPDGMRVSASEYRQVRGGDPETWDMTYLFKGDTYRVIDATFVSRREGSYKEQVNERVISGGIHLRSNKTTEIVYDCSGKTLLAMKKQKEEEEADPRKALLRQQQEKSAASNLAQSRLKQIEVAYECLVPNRMVNAPFVRSFLFAKDGQVYTDLEVIDGSGLPEKSMLGNYQGDKSSDLRWQESNAGFSRDERHVYLIDSKDKTLFVTFNFSGGKTTKQGSCKDKTSSYTTGKTETKKAVSVPGDLQNAANKLFGKVSFLDQKSCVLEKEKDSFNKETIRVKNLDFSTIALKREQVGYNAALKMTPPPVFVLTGRGKSGVVIEEVRSGKSESRRELIVVVGSTPGANEFGVGVASGVLGAVCCGESKSIDEVKGHLSTLKKYCQ